MALSRTALQALEPVVAAVRKVLRDLEPDDVPHRLKRVVAATGSRLPPPLAARLLEELDENEWLRNTLAERLPDDAPELLRAYLERPHGWWQGLAEAVAAVERRSVDAELNELRSRLDDRDRQLAGSAERLAAAKRRHEEGTRSLEDELARARARVRQLQKEQAASEREITGEAEEIAAALEEEVARRREAERARDELRARLRRMRRERRDTTSTGSVEAAPVDDPVALARSADLDAARLGRAPAGAVQRPAAAPGSVRLPEGVRPDSADALRWVGSVDPPVWLIVDGYNVLFHLDSDRDRATEARRRLNEGLRRFRRQSSGRPAITVVYDSRLGGGRRSRSAVDEIEVRFAEPGISADEEIIDLVRDARRAVVVTSDREIQDAAARAGAVVLWSEALAEFVRR